MRGGKFNHEKYLAYLDLLVFLLKLGVVNQNVIKEGSIIAPNPLITAQSLFVDPFDD